jgi:enoyl-CoA hydratase/carnithine racemase
VGADKPAQMFTAEYRMAFETLKLEHVGGVSRIIWDRPPVNSVSMKLITETLDVLDQLEKRKETRCIILTGGGTKAFSAGADLSDSGEKSVEDQAKFRDAGRALLDRIETIPKPVIAAIHGWCIGGGFAVAMACDIRLASTTAKFRTGDAYIGVVPSWGMSLTRLTHYIGRNRALDMLILGEDFDAKGAFDIGLLSKVIPQEQYESEVARLAERVAGGAPITFQAVKQTIRTQYWISPEKAREEETYWADIGAKSKDFAEGKASFREKRKPVFVGS